MPTYGYRCSKCGHELEVLQKITDPPLKTCPECGGELTKKVYAAGVIFKGSGYYTTDYKAAKSPDSTSSNGSGTASEKPSEKASEKTAEKSGESKPAAESKAESKPSKSDSTD
jgi:putative FmdB family regulatory protein